MSSLSLWIVKPANAQSIPTPSVPTFTLQVKPYNNTEPTTYFLNSSSGQIEAQLGHNYSGTTVYAIIQNQPLTSQYNNGDPWKEPTFFYNIQTREPSTSNDWNDLYNVNVGYPMASNSAYTNISIGGAGNGTIEVQVEAMIGSYVQGHNFVIPTPNSFNGTTSGWSDTLSAITSSYIVTLSSAPQSTSNPKVTPIATGSSSASSFLTNAIFLIIIVILLLVIIFLLEFLLLMDHLLNHQKIICFDL
jgi:hypothetical protein